MIPRHFVVPALALTVALVSACGGVAVAPATGTQQSVAARYAAVTSQSGSWMSPAAAKAQSLLYVSDLSQNVVNVYSYDDGKNMELMGSLAIPSPTGVCTDRDGHVWVGTLHPREVHEFDRGGTTQIFLIKLGFGGEPAGCAVDPKSGDLALAVLKSDVKGAGHYGGVDVFHKGFNTGGFYTVPGGFYSIEFPAWDNSRHLFVAGQPCEYSYLCYYIPATAPGLFKLDKNATQFVRVDLGRVTLDTPTGLAWINPSLLLAESNQNGSGVAVGYKFVVTGRKATLTQTIPFKNASSAGGIAERAGIAIVADPQASAVRTYSISNGDPIDAILKGLDSPYAVAVSQATAKTRAGVSK